MKVLQSDDDYPRWSYMNCNYFLQLSDVEIIKKEYFNVIPLPTFLVRNGFNDHFRLSEENHGLGTKCGKLSPQDFKPRAF